MATCDGDTDGQPLAQAREALRAAIPRAARALVELLDAEDPRLKLRAAEAILNRAGIVEASAVKASLAERAVGGERAW